MTAILSDPPLLVDATARFADGVAVSTGDAGGGAWSLRQPRVLAAIASFGMRNIGYLQQMIERYQSMAFPIDVVVLSEAPKDLPPGVEVRVGLPSKNPWSLPFAHKQLFADKLEEYDLFIYSEDDIGVSEANLLAFLDASGKVRDDEIPGFMRYEKDASGTVWMPDVHSLFRWDPHSVVERDGEVFARYTNEHAAFYMLTRAQLRAAIASGGFLRPPYEGKYDMLCAAATDPYTSCGMRKLVSVSKLDDFLVRHLSDRYAGLMGLPLSAFSEQLQTLQAINAGSHPAATLCEVESKLQRGIWSKELYEKSHQLVLDAIPASAATVLSVGCGSGALEEEIQKRGADVTALAVDSVLGQVAATRGVRVVTGTFREALESLSGRTFDCVVVTNLLHLQRDPRALLTQLLPSLRQGGTVVIESPNFASMSVWAKRIAGRQDYDSLGSFDRGGVTPLGARRLLGWLRTAGFLTDKPRWFGHALPKKLRLSRVAPHLGGLSAQGFVVRASSFPPQKPSSQSR